MSPSNSNCKISHISFSLLPIGMSETATTSPCRFMPSRILPRRTCFIFWFLF